MLVTRVVTPGSTVPRVSSPGVLSRLLVWEQVARVALVTRLHYPLGPDLFLLSGVVLSEGDVATVVSLLTVPPSRLP